MRLIRWRLGIAASASFAVLLAGCLVTSLRPLSDETYPPVFDNALLGRWIGVGENGELREEGKSVHLLFEPYRSGMDRVYRITRSEIDNQAVTTTVLYGSLVDIGPLRILDTSIGDDAIPKALGSEVAGAHLRGVHFFSRVTMADNTLLLSALHNEWFMASALEEGLSVPCVFDCGNDSIEYCDVLLTGTPPQLRAFFREYGDQPRLFRGSGSSKWRRE